MNLENKSNIVIEDGNGFMRLFSAEPTETVAKKLLMEYGEIEGFKVVLDEILDLQNSEVYQKLVILDNPIDSSVNLKYAIKNDQYTDLQRLANKYLSAFPLRLPLTPVINIKDFAVTYTFIGYLYSIRTGCRIYQEDLQKIEQGDMVTRIVLLLDKFNKPEKTPKTTPEFFKMLNKLKWQDRRTKRFLNDISNLYFTLSFNKWGGRNVGWNFSATENAFLLLLSGCSAVNGGKDRISVDDVIRANKTYLKLINTDIRELM